VKREVYEETGLKIKAKILEDIFELIVRERDKVKFHYIIIDYRGKIVGGELKVSTDAADVKWFGKEQLRKIKITSITGKLIKKLMERGEIK